MPSKPTASRAFHRNRRDSIAQLIQRKRPKEIVASFEAFKQKGIALYNAPIT